MLKRQARLLNKNMPSFATLPAKIISEALPYFERGKRRANTKQSDAQIIAQRAIKHGWDQHNDVLTCMNLGYTRARIFRACLALVAKDKTQGWQLPVNLSLNQLLDATEAEAEQHEMDENIEIAIEIAQSGDGDDEIAGTTNVDNRQFRNHISKTRLGQFHTSPGTHSGRNSDQRVLELESQIDEMCTDLENALQCSITMEVCKDPVVAPSGHVYERSKIMHWIRLHGNDPQTRARLKASQLYRIRAVADLGEKYRKRGMIE